MLFSLLAGCGMVIPENIHEKQRLDLAKEQLAQTEELKE